MDKIQSGIRYSTQQSHTKRWTAGTAAALLTAALLLTACGGGNNDAAENNSGGATVIAPTASSSSGSTSSATETPEASATEASSGAVTETGTATGNTGATTVMTETGTLTDTEVTTNTEVTTATIETNVITETNVMTNTDVTTDTGVMSETEVLTGSEGATSTEGITSSESTSQTSAIPAATTGINVVNDPALGDILVNDQGMTLYVYDKDTEGKSNCTGQCLEKWPAVSASDENATITPGDGITGELGVITRDDGTYQVTINGMPLYTYYEDAAPGDVNGQAVGDVWWVVAPDGSKITKQ